MLQKLLALLCFAGLVPTLAGSDKTEDVKLEDVPFAKLQEAIAAKKGTIVVVDVWATDCIPCRKNFPHLVDLHKKHAKAGVVCMSVSVDPGKKTNEALKFLKDKGATFSNYRLTDPSGTLNKKWNFNGIPAVTVFDRKGEPKYFNNNDPDKPYSYDDVTQYVDKLLEEK